MAGLRSKPTDVTQLIEPQVIFGARSHAYDECQIAHVVDQARSVSVHKPSEQYQCLWYGRRQSHSAKGLSYHDLEEIFAGDEPAFGLSEETRFDGIEDMKTIQDPLWPRTGPFASSISTAATTWPGQHTGTQSTHKAIRNFDPGGVEEHAEDLTKLTERQRHRFYRYRSSSQQDRNQLYLGGGIDLFVQLPVAVSREESQLLHFCK